jgi:hypothetical protein
VFTDDSHSDSSEVLGQTSRRLDIERQTIDGDTHSSDSSLDIELLNQASMNSNELSTVRSAKSVLITKRTQHTPMPDLICHRVGPPITFGVDRVDHANAWEFGFVLLTTAEGRIELDSAISPGKLSFYHKGGRKSKYYQGSIVKTNVRHTKPKFSPVLVNETANRNNHTETVVKKSHPSSVPLTTADGNTRVTSPIKKKRRKKNSKRAGSMHSVTSHK